MANSAKCGVNRRIAAESSTGYAGTPGAPKSGRVNRAVAGIGPDSAVTDLHAILEIAAIAHGEWVRIQPLANGNGRIARLWVDWVAVRYGLPFFLALKPRSLDAWR